MEPKVLIPLVLASVLTPIFFIATLSVYILKRRRRDGSSLVEQGLKQTQVNALNALATSEVAPRVFSIHFPPPISLEKSIDDAFSSRFYEVELDKPTQTQTGDDVGQSRSSQYITPPASPISEFRVKEEENHEIIEQQNVETTTPSVAEVRQELMQTVDEYVANTGLEKFFTNDSPFIQDIASRAMVLQEDPSTDLGQPELLKSLTTLSLYQLVIYCDDSGSMGGRRFYQQQELVTRITRVATKILPEGFGVQLKFMNAKSLQQPAYLTPSNIEEVYNRVSPSRGTPIGTNLRSHILDPFVYDVLNKEDGRLERPMLICTITDGCPNGEAESTLKDEIVQCRRFLRSKGYNPNAVMHCVCQIGDDALATEFLQQLKASRQIEDVMYVTTNRLDKEFEELRSNERRLETWLLKLLTTPIMGRE